MEFAAQHGAGVDRVGILSICMGLLAESGKAAWLGAATQLIVRRNQGPLHPP